MKFKCKQSGMLYSDCHRPYVIPIKPTEVKEEAEMNIPWFYILSLVRFFRNFLHVALSTKLDFGP